MSIFIKKQLDSGNGQKMQGNLPKSESGNVFENAEIVK